MLQRKVDCSTSKNTKIQCDGSKTFEGTFRMAVWPILFIGQLYGAMPVVGISSRSLSDLHFNWKSFRTIYAGIVAIILSSYCMFLLWKTLTNATTLNLLNFLFYAMNTFGLVSFFVLSLHWPQLMEHWQSIESLPIFQNFVHKTAYTRRIRLISATVLLLAAFEHCLFIGVTIKSSILYQKDEDIFLGLVKRMVPNLIPLENPPSNYVALTFCYMAENATFMWNFVDIFIMVIGIGLTTHFKVFNNKFQQTNFQIVDLPSDYFAKMRSQYTKLCELVEMIDGKISHLLLLSFSNNLLMIWQQLFESLRPLPTHLHLIYFWYSLSFVIMRTFAVSFFTARINDESRKPLVFLRSIPTHLWNEETKRLRGDILSKRIALSGMEIFYVTRQFILSVIGTIITYELVVIEFNRK